MNPRLKRILVWVGYPLFYLFALFLFAYWTFPYERIRDRIIADYNANRTPDSYRLEIEDLDGYWLSGIEIENATMTPPPPPKSEADADGGAPEPKVIEIGEAHARASILRLLLGTMHLSFGAEAFGGELDGVWRDGSDEKSIEMELDEVDVGQMPYLSEAVGGLPMGGALTGTVSLVMPEGKLSKASGTIELNIVDLSIGDGKTKMKDVPLPALPKLRAGDLELKAEATEGRMKVTKLEAKGTDLEVISEGKIRLRDPLDSSLAELNLRYKFSDKYRTKNDVTKALFGDPVTKSKGLMDLDPKVKRASRPDGFYAWRMTGPLGKLSFQPSSMSSRKRPPPRRPRKK